MIDVANISDHGLIGDLQTAALVDVNGTIDWFCCPRFDAPSVFASLLDSERGGFFRIAPDGTDYVTRQLYLPETAILVTRFMSEGGVGEVVDFMPVAEGPATDRHRIVRLVRVVRGTMRFVAEIEPRFDYARKSHSVAVTDAGAVFESDDMSLTMHRVGTPVLRGEERAARVERTEQGIRITTQLNAGEVTGLMLESGGARPREISPDELIGLFLDTRRFWRLWLDRSTYTGRWRETVTRSAMTLKLMTYAPTGGLVAAPTCALPEQVGGERNWDYRYTWVRDASFSVYALLGLGYTDEAEAFVSWLMDRIAESAGEKSGPLKIMYRVDGSSDLVEETLDHLDGYRGSRPGAHRQRSRRPAPARHLRRSDGRHLPCRHPRSAAAACGLGAGQGHARLGVRKLGQPGGGDLGDAVGAVRSSPTAVSCAGLPWIAPYDLRSHTADRPRPCAGPSNATGSTSRSWPTAGTRAARPSCSTTTPRCSTPRCS